MADYPANQQDRAAGKVSTSTDPTHWHNARQRDDLKGCPFCGTRAQQHERLADNETGIRYRVQCGNPFCMMVCRTEICAALADAESQWNERAQPKELWHLLAGNTGERSQGMCGQVVEDGHCATTELENVRCMACLVAEIREYRDSMKRIIKIAEGGV